MKLLLHYLNKHKKYVALALLMTVINQCAAFVDPLITGRIVDQLINKGQKLPAEQCYHAAMLLVGLAFVAIVILRLANNFQDAYTKANCWNKALRRNC